MAGETVTLNGIKVRYDVEGEGPDVLLIHGWVASRRMWAHLTSSLSAAYRCWAIDLPGCGDSDKPANGWYSIPRYTAILKEFIWATGLHRARIVGHSMGGMIALDLAATHPETVEKLIAINPVVTGKSTLRPLAKVGRGWLDLTLRLSPLILQPVLRLGSGLHGMPYILRRTEDFSKGTPDSVLNSGRAVVAYDVSPRLGAITAPTLVILGNLDPTVPNSEGHLAAARIPGARLTMMRAGHLPTDDRPAEILQHMRKFLA